MYLRMTIHLLLILKYRAIKRYNEILLNVLHSTVHTHCCGMPLCLLCIIIELCISTHLSLPYMHLAFDTVSETPVFVCLGDETRVESSTVSLVS